MLRVHRPLGSMLLLCNNTLVSGTGRAVPRGSRRRSLHGRSGTSESSSAIAWSKPEAGRLKLNFDGSSKREFGRASIGGVYRDHEGGFVLGYAERLVGPATSSVAELAALRRGLELAVANGWRSVWVEGDFMTAVDVVQSRGALAVREEEGRRLCEEIAALLPMLDDDVRASHVDRRGNRVAHGFAKLGHAVEKPRVWRDAPPKVLLQQLQRDAQGK